MDVLAGTLTGGERMYVQGPVWSVTAAYIPSGGLERLVKLLNGEVLPV